MKSPRYFAYCLGYLMIDRACDLKSASTHYCRVAQFRKQLDYIASERGIGVNIIAFITCARGKRWTKHTRLERLCRFSNTDFEVRGSQQ